MLSVAPSHSPVVPADVTGDSDMPEMDSLTPSVPVDDTTGTTGMNMSDMDFHLNYGQDSTTMSDATTEMNTTGMHSMNHSVDSSGDVVMNHSIPSIPSQIYQSQFGTSQESRSIYTADVATPHKLVAH